MWEIAVTRSGFKTDNTGRKGGGTTRRRLRREIADFLSPVSPITILQRLLYRGKRRRKREEELCLCSTFGRGEREGRDEK